MPHFTPRRAITPAEILTWRNRSFDYAVVQALPRDGDPERRVFRRERCARHRESVYPFALDGHVPMADGTTKIATAVVRGDRFLNKKGEPIVVRGVWVGDRLVELGVDEQRCAGTSKHAMSGVLLDRHEALHAIHAHYLFANQSVCRFWSAARGDYAADLVFEIDVHDAIGDAVPLDWFFKYIGAAVAVGRRVLDHLIGELLIDPKYVTVSVTRMGCRVTVDWRAFGPHRLHQLVLVLRFIEAQVLADGEFAALATKHGVPKIEIDTGIYERSDLPRQGVDESNAFTGSWLRPVGAMHSKSGQGGWWYRVTPVPHDKFTSENAAWLVKESRGRDADWRAWSGRELKPSFMWSVPESRNPKLDAVVEADPKPAWKLIELFERDDLLDHVPEVHRNAIRTVQQRSRASRFDVPREYMLDAEDIERVVQQLGVDVREKHDRWDVNCPRSSCKARDFKGRVFKDSGVYKCWRCCATGMSLVSLAAELGLSSLIPGRVASSTPMAMMPVAEVPSSTFLTSWGKHVEVVERTFDDPRELWSDRRRELQRFREGDDKRLFIDASALGSGKSTTTRAVLHEGNVRHRSLVPRDEAKLDYLGEVDDAVAVMGRRLGVNCTNEALEQVADRREPIAKTLCSVCPQREGCSYYAQFADLASHSLVLSHAHGGMLHLDVFDNETQIDIVDEDALSAVGQHDDLDAEELDRFRVGLGFDFGEDDDDVTLDVDAHPCGATATLERIISRLQALLTTDAVVKHQLQAGRDGELVDLALARFLLADRELRDAIYALGKDDVDEHEARRIELLQQWQDDVVGEQPEIIGHIYPAHFEAEWMRSKQRADALLDQDPLAELFAWHHWVNAHLEPMRAKRDPRIHRRPKDIIGPLSRALNAAYYMATTGTNRPLALQAYRPAKSGSWVLRLTTRRPFLAASEKVVHLSATAVPERVRLMYGAPTEQSRWVVYKATLTKKERRIVVGDRSYSRAGIFAEKAEDLRRELLETVNKLIETERTRTGLPVAVIGASRVMNWYLEAKLGKQAREFTMPWKGSERADKMAGLKALTTPLGFIAGYAHGVAGSNDFAVEDNGIRRFVRSLIVLGNIVPDLADVARDHRGLFAGVRDEAIDWTPTFRVVPFEGQENDDQVLVAKNVVGYRDDVANAVLHGIYQGELLQIVGRMRGQLQDPVDPTITPIVYMFAAVAIEGFEVDEVIALDELRVRLRLSVKEGKPRGRRSTVPLEVQVRRRWNKDGPTATMRWLVKGYFAVTKSDTAVTQARLAIEGAGLDFKGGLIAIGNEAVGELLKADRSRR